jgi:RNA polymerase sigma-70 factor (ECF subfamily)
VPTPPVTTGTAASPSLVDEADLEQYRRELTGYCYRMLGSGSEAEDAVQETMVRAWRALDRFEGRSSLRSWLYRIASNVCLDMLQGPQRRARPMDLGPASTADVALPDRLGQEIWVQPIADDKVVPNDADPAEVAVARETIRLAFVAALQHLPPRQRAVLILREVLRWHADEVAELLDTTVAAVNSSLQRARATLGAVTPIPDATVGVDPEQEALVARYVDAFERYDIATLVGLLHEDAVMSMPPWNLWLQGPTEISKWFLGQGRECEGSRLIATSANGSPAFGSYRKHPEGGHFAWAIQVLEVEDGRITGHHNFVDPDLFAEFGLPDRIED